RFGFEVAERRRRRTFTVALVAATRTIGTIGERADQRRRETVERPAAAGDEHLRHNGDAALGDGVRHRDDRGRPLADGLALLLEPGGAGDPECPDRLALGETDGLAPRRLGAACDLDVGGLTLTLGAPRLGLVLLDLHTHLRARELRLHVGGAL